MTDTPIMLTAATSQAKINYRCLTEVNSRYFGVSLMRTLTQGPYSVHCKWSWLDIETLNVFTHLVSSYRIQISWNKRIFLHQKSRSSILYDSFLYTNMAAVSMLCTPIWSPWHHSLPFIVFGRDFTKLFCYVNLENIITWHESGFRIRFSWI